jgi:diacylglycerol kinase (ATP)
MPVGTDLVLAATVVVIVTAATGGLWYRRSVRRRRERRRWGLWDLFPGQEHRPRAAVIANPTKLKNREALRSSIDAIGLEQGYAPSLWWETSKTDPGSGQTTAALQEEVNLVFAFGGDGTARAVAATLAGSRTPLALLPAGTGNLLARNLQIPVGHQDEAIALGFSGQERRIDVGRAEVDRSGEDEIPRRETFLVMAGLGFDAEIMASVEPGMKKRMGWWAYVVAGARLIRGRQTKVTLYLDDEPPVRRRIRTVVVGNCGSLTGGIHLLPDASPDDGWLDVVAISPRGIVGWAAVTASVASRMRRGHPLVERFRCRRVEIRAETPLHVQLDGDPTGRARVLRTSVDPGALLIRTPRRPTEVSRESGTGADIEGSPDPETGPDHGNGIMDSARLPTSSGPAVAQRHHFPWPVRPREAEPARRIGHVSPTPVPRTREHGKHVTGFRGGEHRCANTGLGHPDEVDSPDPR